MKYPFIVKKNDVWYPAGAEVPEDTSSIDEIVDNSSYTKTEIQRMPIAELKSLAIRLGVENASEMTGSALKKILINILDL